MPFGIVTLLILLHEVICAPLKQSSKEYNAFVKKKKNEPTSFCY